MDSPLKIFHGSPNAVNAPSLAAGRPRNDFGRGFYCSADWQLAAEWACKSRNDGFVNEYSLNAAPLRTLDLLSGEYSVLHWIALLLRNRTFSLQLDAARQAREFMIKNYLLDTACYDIVIGYRADDSYFSYAQAFVENGLTIRQLSQALRLGNLGEQIVLVSKRAFENLRFLGAHGVKAADYYPRFKRRDTAARMDYRKAISCSPIADDDLFVFDIMRKGVDIDDWRIQRNLP